MFLGLASLTPPENGSRAFPGPKQCQHFPPKRWVPERCLFNFFTCPHPTHPVKTIQNRQLQLTVCLEGQRPSCALRPPLPSPWFHCSTGLRSGTFTWSNSVSGPEFLPPLNPMHPEALSMPPLLFTQPHFSWVVSAVYICTVHPVSRSLLPPPPPPHVKPQNLVQQNVRCHPSSLMCEGALVCIL